MCRSDMEALLGRFVSAAAALLKDDLTGIYLHGSAAMGGFQVRKSDLDLLVVVREDLPMPEKRALLDLLMSLDREGPAKGIEVSVLARKACDPFVHPAPFLLHYSGMHREWAARDPEDYLRKMNGTDRDLAAHAAVLRERGRCLWGLPIREVFGAVPEEAFADSILNDIEGAEERIADDPAYYLLNLARTLAWVKEKRILSKTEGGEWGLGHLPETYRPLLLAALQEYREGADGRYDPAAAKRYAAYMLMQIRAGRKKAADGEADPMPLPKPIAAILGDQAGETDRLGKSGAKVVLYRDHVLKVRPADSPDTEDVSVLRWLGGKLPVPRTEAHLVADGQDWLLMTRVRGRMLCDPAVMEKPALLLDCMAEALHLLWRIPVRDCPFDRSAGMLLAHHEKTILSGAFDPSDCEPETFGPGGFKDPPALLRWLKEHLPPEDLAAVHGDFCLPNLFTDGKRFTGFIDMGSFGAADRWMDLALGWRSLKHNSDGHYGRVWPKIDPDDLFRAAGVPKDPEKLRYYLLLDELN